MAESAALAVLLKQAGSVFTSVHTLAAMLGHRDILEDDLELFLDEVRQGLAKLRDATRDPPDGFAEVAEQLNRLASLLQDTNKAEQENAAASRESILMDLVFFDNEGHGHLALREAIMRCPDALVAQSEQFFTSLDDYPASASGNIKFLEMVRDEVSDAAEAKRQRIERQYTYATLTQMVEGIKWLEARLRTTLLSDLPADVVDHIAKVLGRELTVGTVEQIDELLTPAVRKLREAFENRKQDDEQTTPFQVWPEGDEESGKPLRFDPRQWTFVGSKLIRLGWDSTQYCSKYCGDETLYCGGKDRWIVIQEVQYWEADLPSDPTYRFISENQAGEWFLDCEDDPPPELLEAVANRSLSPKNPSSGPVPDTSEETKPYSDPANYARNKWLYENIESHSFRELSDKLKNIARKEKYNVISSRQGIKKSVDNYADYHKIQRRRFRNTKADDV